MINITKRLIPESKYSIKSPYTMTPELVVIHNTANDASAANEISYMTTSNNLVSFHYAVDDLGAVQGIAENRSGWHAGDGNGSGNRKGIGIEICYSKSGGDRFVKAERNAAELTADILKRYSWDISRVKKHQDFSGKYCPHRTLDLGWQRFLDMVSVFMKSNVSISPSTPTITAPVKSDDVKAGDVVKINEQATYYTGGAIPSWVKNQRWIVREVKGNRAVIDRNETGTSSINSPINVRFLEVINSGKVTISPKKSVDELAQEVISGKWGNGETRKKSLAEAGHDPTAVQARVNQLLK